MAVIRRKPRKKKMPGIRTTSGSISTIMGIFLVFGLLIYFRDQRSSVSIIGISFLFILLLLFSRRHKLSKSMKQIDAMSGHEFEEYLVRFFEALGYKAQNVGAKGADFGADLIVKKDNIKYAVQAKNYGTSTVGNAAVQQAIAGATYYDCEQAMVVTNSTFTKAAIEQATASQIIPVTLWDREEVEKALKQV